MSSGAAAVEAYFGVYEITQAYGPTSLSLEPAYGGYAHFHMGVDYGGPDGYPLPSIVFGTVILAGMVNNGYGVQVNIDIGNGCYIKYGHMSAVAVSVGDNVAIGQTIGWQDNTGASTGSHLHVGEWCNGTPYDPTPLIDAARSGQAVLVGPILPSLPPPDTSESYYSQFLPETMAAWESLKVNVNTLLPNLYTATIGVERTVGRVN